MQTPTVRLQDPDGSRSNATIGLLFAAISATSLGVVTTFARLAYDNGATPFAFITWRYVVGLMAALTIAGVLKRSLKVPRAALMPVAAVTLAMAMISIGYLSSVHFIPVGLAALLFYTYPILVLAITTVIARELPGPYRIAAFVLAFAGLALALGPSLEGLDWRGVSYALIASLGAAILFVMTPRATQHISVYTLTIWAFVGGLVLSLIVLPWLGDYAMPHANLGWTGFSLAISLYIFGQLTNFAALRHAEPARAALIYNLEPLIAIIAAAVVLDETMLPLQYAGGGLVIGALIIAARRQAGTGSTSPRE